MVWAPRLRGKNAGRRELSTRACHFALVAPLGAGVGVAQGVGWSLCVGISRVLAFLPHKRDAQTTRGIFTSAETFPLAAPGVVASKFVSAEVKLCIKLRSVFKKSEHPRCAFALKLVVVLPDGPSLVGPLGERQRHGWQ